MIRLRWQILVASAALTVGAVSAARHLDVATNLEALMPEGTPSVTTLQQVLEKTGSFASIKVVIRSGDQEAARTFAGDLKALAESMDWVASAAFGEDVSVFERHKLLYLETDRLAEINGQLDGFIAHRVEEVVKSATGRHIRIHLRTAGPVDRQQAAELMALLNPEEAAPARRSGQRLFQSPDGLTTLLVVWPKDGDTGADVSKAMIADLERAVATLNPPSYAPDLRVGIAGRIKNRVAQFDAIARDVATSLVGAGILILLILVFAFRSAAAVVYIVPPLILSIVWTMGLTALVIGGLNLITVFLGLILFGLGIDFGIHNLARYREARSAGHSLQSALAIVLGRTGHASLAAGLTTAAGFLALTLTDFRAFAEFGFIAGAGILLAFAAMYTVFPALVAALDPVRLLRPRVSGQITKEPIFPSPKLVIPAAAGVLSLALVFAFQTQFEKNFRNLQAEQSPAHRWANAEARRVFKGGHDRAVLWVESLEEVAAITAYFDDHIRRDTRTPTIDKVRSLYDFIPPANDQAERLALIWAIRDRLPDSAGEPYDQDWRRYLEIGPIGIEDLPETVRRLLIGVDDEPGHLIYIHNSVTMDDAGLAREFYNDAASFTVGGKTYAPAAEAFVFVEMLALMKADAVRAVLLVVLVTLPVVFLLFRSLKDAAIAFAPALAGLLLTLGLMGALGIRLSIINMVILPSIIGIGVDNGIHIFYRFRETGQRGLGRIMATTGRAATITTVTTLLGFGGMATASVGGLRSLGLVAIIGFSSCLLATWTLLPALLQLNRSGRRTGEAMPAQKRGLVTRLG